MLLFYSSYLNIFHMSLESCNFSEKEIKDISQLKENILEESQEWTWELRNEVIDNEREYTRFSQLIDSYIESLSCDTEKKQNIQAVIDNVNEVFQEASFQVRSENVLASIKSILEPVDFDNIPWNRSVMRYLWIPEHFRFEKTYVDSSSSWEYRTIIFHGSNKITRYILSIYREWHIKLKLSTWYNSGSSVINFSQNLQGRKDDRSTRKSQDVVRYINKTDLSDLRTYQISYISELPKSKKGVLQSLTRVLPSAPRSRDEKVQQLIAIREELDSKTELTVEELEEFMLRIIDASESFKIAHDIVKGIWKASPEILHLLLDQTNDWGIIGAILEYSWIESDFILEESARKKMRPLQEQEYPFVYLDSRFTKLSLQEQDSIITLVEKGALVEREYSDFLELYYGKYFLSSDDILKFQWARLLYYASQGRQENLIPYFEEAIGFSVVDGKYSPDGDKIRRVYSILGRGESKLSDEQRRTLAKKAVKVHEPVWLSVVIDYLDSFSKQWATFEEFESMIDILENIIPTLPYPLLNQIRRKIEHWDPPLIPADIVSLFENIWDIQALHERIFPDGFYEEEEGLVIFLNWDWRRDIDISKDSLVRLKYRWGKLPQDIAQSPRDLSLFMSTFKDVNERELDFIKNLENHQLNFMISLLRRKKNDNEAFKTPKDAMEFLQQVWRIQSKIHADFVLARRKNREPSSLRINYDIDYFSSFDGHWDQLKQGVWKYDIFSAYLDWSGFSPQLIIQYQDFILWKDTWYLALIALGVIRKNWLSFWMIVQKLEACEECKNLDRDWKKIFNRYVNQTTNIDEALKLAVVLEQIAKIERGTKSILYMLIDKIPMDELVSQGNIFLSREWSTYLEPILEKYKTVSWRVIWIFFQKYISESELQNPQAIAKRFEKFLEKVGSEWYDRSTDPVGDKMDALVYDFETVLFEENTDIFHVSFILNFMLWKSVKIKWIETTLDTKRLKKIGFDMLNNNSKEVMQQKGAMILMGTGVITSEFSLWDLQEMTAITVDKKLTQFDISKDITQDQLDYLSSKSIPLSLYYSILGTLREQEQDWDFDEFKNKIYTYEKLKDGPLFIWQVVALYHSEWDSHHTNIWWDLWGTEFYEWISQSLGIPFTSIRHWQWYETKDTMFAFIEQNTNPWPVTFLIWGHGNDNVISFWSERFDIPELFESLKKRQQKVWWDWEVRLFFESCYSETNLKILFELWKSDPQTKNISLSIVSSSSEWASSYKMAVDAWRNYAWWIEKGNSKPNWQDFYSQVESKNFILTRPRNFWNNVNSNMSLWINGEKLW